MKKIILSLALLLICVFANAQTSVFTFVKEPVNSDFPFAGQSFEVEGELVAEHNFDSGKSQFYATQRAEHDDILVTSVSFNVDGEAESVTFFYITKEQSEELEFSTLTNDEMLDVTINFNPIRTETISQINAEKKEYEFDGFLMRSFKTKKELEDFKKFLKRN
jgi:hypothetical protein